MQPVTLCPSKLKWGLFLVFAVILAAACLYGMFNGRIWTSAVLVIAAIGLAYFSIQQLKRGSAYLLLDNDGFEYKQFNQHKRYQWADVISLSVWSQRGASFVTFALRQTQSKKWWARMLSRGQLTLPDTYGMKAKVLLALMEEYRTAAKNAADISNSVDKTDQASS